MLKVAFIGDSYSSYVQTGQGMNSWTYLLAKHFPQHQYYNYAFGGRGYDFYQLCLLDAKIRNIDVILINKTFPHRVSELHGDNSHSFTATTIDDNYFTLYCENIVWYTAHVDTIHLDSKKAECFSLQISEDSQVLPKIIPPSLFNSYNEVLRYKSVSGQNIDYNEKWYENMHSLYNFKDIVKLSLIRDSEDPSDSASKQLQKAFGIDIEKVLWEPSNELFDKGLTVSLTDDHWSPLANQWVFDNYILPRVVDILS